MHKPADPIVYKGMTASQITEVYDDTLSIPNLFDLLKKKS